MIYEGPTPTWGPNIKITDTSPSFIYARRYKVTSYSVRRRAFVKEHGNSRSKISNVSISFYKQSTFNLTNLYFKYIFVCPLQCMNFLPYN